MSKGWGRVERAIIDAILKDPTATFSTSELCALAYPGTEPSSSQRVAVLRSARNVARAEWCEAIPISKGAAGVIYVNPFDLISYCMGQMRAEFRDKKPVWELRAIINDPTQRYRAFAEDGGLWSLIVRRNNLVIDLEPEQAARVQKRIDQIEQDIEQRRAAA